MSKVVYKKEVDFLLNYLIHTFGYNKPFTISEIDYKDYSRAWIYKRITKLCEDGKIMRFERSAYYIRNIFLVYLKALQTLLKSILTTKPKEQGPLMSVAKDFTYILQELKSINLTHLFYASWN